MKCVHPPFTPSQKKKNADADLLINFRTFQAIHGLQMCPQTPVGTGREG